MKYYTPLWLFLGVVMLVFCISIPGRTQQFQECRPDDPPGELIAQASRQNRPPQEAPQMDRRQDVPQVQVPGDLGGVRLNWNKLGLSSEQKRQMLQKRREFQINTATVREELKYVEQDLRLELEKEPVDREKIEALLKRQSSLKQQLSAAAVQNLLDIKGILTPEQLEKFTESRNQIPGELQALKLSSEQREQIQEIMKNAVILTRERSEVLRDLREELQDLLFSSQEVDAAKLSQIQADIARNELEVEKGKIEMFLQIKDVLTPEQRQRYQKIRTMIQQEKPDMPQRRAIQ